MRIKAARSIKHKTSRRQRYAPPTSQQNNTQGTPRKTTPPPVNSSRSNSSMKRQASTAAQTTSSKTATSNATTIPSTKQRKQDAAVDSVVSPAKKNGSAKGNVHTGKAQGNGKQHQQSNTKSNQANQSQAQSKHYKHQNAGKTASPSGRATPIAGGGIHTSSPQNTAGSAAAFTPPPRQIKVLTRQEKVRKVERHSYIRPVKIVRGESPLEPSLRTIKVIAQLVRAGNVPDIAARACGVPRHVFNRWIQRGVTELNDPAYDPKVPTLYAALVLAVDAADAQDECTDIMLISQRIDGWQALGWKRERKSSARWGNKAEVRVGGVADQPIQIETTTKELDVDQAATLLSILEATGALPALLQRPVDAKAEAANAEGSKDDAVDVKVDAVDAEDSKASVKTSKTSKG